MEPIDGHKMTELRQRHAEFLADAVLLEMGRSGSGSDTQEEVRRALLSVFMREGVVALSAYSKPDLKEGMSSTPLGAIPTDERNLLLEALKRYSFL